MFVLLGARGGFARGAFGGVVADVVHLEGGVLDAELVGEQPLEEVAPPFEAEDRGRRRPGFWLRVPYKPPQGRSSRGAAPEAPRPPRGLRDAKNDFYRVQGGGAGPC